MTSDRLFACERLGQVLQSSGLEDNHQMWELFGPLRDIVVVAGGLFGKESMEHLDGPLGREGMVFHGIHRKPLILAGKQRHLRLGQ